MRRLTFISAAFVINGMLFLGALAMGWQHTFISGFAGGILAGYFAFTPGPTPLRPA